MTEFNTLSINAKIHTWHKTLLKKFNDIIIIKDENEDNLIWFLSNYHQYLIRKGNSEVLFLHGSFIENLTTFISQINYISPVGYKLNNTIEALYDLLLNFETEPKERFLFWNDATNTINKNRKDFEEIFESMIVAAYCNRNKISTIKSDNSRYYVNQRNIFIMNRDAFNEIEFLLFKKYFIPSIDTEHELYQELNFNIFEISG